MTARGTLQAGRGDRPAFFLHCALAHKAAWSRVMEHLDADLRMTSVDLPGHGDAPDWDGTEDYHTASTTRAANLLTERADLVGHSFGATVALRLAIEKPDLVRSLVLVEPVFFAAARAAGAPEYDRMRRESAPFVAALEADDDTSATRRFNEIWGAGRAWEALPRRQREYMIDRIGLVAAGTPALEDDIAGLLAPGRLEGLRQPVTLIRGQRSHPVIRAVHEALDARLPDARREVIAGAAHMVPLSHPAAVAGLIRRHLERATEAIWGETPADAS